MSFRTLGWVCLLVVLAATGFGQRSVVRSGSFEIGPFVGSSYGIDKFRVMAGGNVTYGFNTRILGYAEYSYFPGLVRTIKSSSGGLSFTVKDGIPLSDFHAGVHIRFPIRESPIVPYFVFGLGSLTHFGRTADVTYTDINGNLQSLKVPVPGGSDFAFNTGGGLRYYVNERFGVRAEAKVYKPSGTFTDTFGKVEFGLFYQTR